MERFANSTSLIGGTKILRLIFSFRAWRASSSSTKADAVGSSKKGKKLVRDSWSSRNRENKVNKNAPMRKLSKNWCKNFPVCLKKVNFLSFNSIN